jgi:sec-independent protein translocase protein TatB
MFSLSPIKILVIVAVVLILLGPDKLPEVAHRLGTTWRSLKRLQERVESEVREVMPDLPSSSEIARIARSPVNLLNQLADRADAREADDQPSPAPAEHPPVEEPEIDLSAPPPPVPREPRPVDGSASPDPSLN